MFNIYDMDQDGFISRAEFRLFFENYFKVLGNKPLQSFGGKKYPFSPLLLIHLARDSHAFL